MIDYRISQYSDHFISVNGIIALSLKRYVFPTDYRGHGLHKHHYLEVSLITKGRARYYVDGQTMTIQAGDILLLNGSKEHGIIDIQGDESFGMLVIHFEPEFFYSIENPLLDFRFLQMFFEGVYGDRHRLSGDEDLLSNLRTLILTIENEFLSRAIGYDLSVKLKLFELMLELIRFYDIEIDALNQNENNDHLRLIREAKIYIHQHFNEEISLKRISKHLSISESYVSTLFKKYTGISLIKYINSVRISKSMELIETSKMSILSIAIACGFNNTSNFNKLFKRQTGMKPSEYRKKVVAH